jgi:6-phosphofructokinase 1
MAFGNLALDLVLAGESGKLVSVHNGRYDAVSIERVTASKKVVDIHEHYLADRLRPRYETFAGRPLFIMTGDP